MEEGQKVLVFSQFVELLELLRPALRERNWPVFYLAGDTENRGELVQSFQNAPGAAMFLISLKAGGFGLNLTAASSWFCLIRGGTPPSKPSDRPHASHWANEQSGRVSFAD